MTAMSALVLGNNGIHGKIPQGIADT